MAGTSSRVAAVCALAIVAIFALSTAWNRPSRLNTGFRVRLAQSPSYRPHVPRAYASRNSIQRIRKSCLCRAIGLFYSTQTGNMETIAGKIGEMCGVEAKEIGDVSISDLSGYDGLIVGAPTWHTDADTERSGTAWDDALEEIRALSSISGKKVAVFGVGDSVGYSDNFCDAIEELHDAFATAGANMVGYVDPSDYQ